MRKRITLAAVILVTCIFAGYAGYGTPASAADVPGYGQIPIASSAALQKHITESYYIKENAARYIEYIKKYPSLPPDTAIAYVNVNVDKGPYIQITEIIQPASILAMCNKNHMFPASYAPDDLIKVGGTSQSLRAEAAAAYEAMAAAMKEDGLRIIPYSGYRSYWSQATLYRTYALRDGAARADTYSARAGHSEHQTGLAIDVLHKWWGGSLTSARFENTKEYEWLMEHAHEYGFILRYPKEFSHITGYTYEPWHWRYIGVEDATRMKDEGIETFEEYFGKYLITSLS